MKVNWRTIRLELQVFLKLWFMLWVAYVIANVTYDLAVFEWVDLRNQTLSRMLYLPCIQALAFQLVTYRQRRQTREGSGPL